MIGFNFVYFQVLFFLGLEMNRNKMMNTYIFTSFNKKLIHGISCFFSFNFLMEKQITSLCFWVLFCSSCVKSLKHNVFFL